MLECAGPVDKAHQMRVSQEASAISGGLKEAGAYAAAFGEVRKMAELKELGKLMGPFLGTQTSVTNSPTSCDQPSCCQLSCCQPLCY